ncbi:MAG: hypothetical protein ACT452_12790 [Microthrixaceae bacterium]
MADEQIEVVAALRRRLEEDYGVRAAAYLVERPAGGWESLVTKEHLDLRFEALRQEFKASFERELRILGWKLAGALIAGLAATGALLRL